MFDKDRAISELERFKAYISETRLKPKEGLAAGGLPPEEFAKYPPGTPGIHPYCDAEMVEEASADILIHYFKTGETIQPKILPDRYLNKKLATIYNMILNPQCDSFMAAESGRGIDILLALCIRNDWKWLLSYDKVEAYGRLIHGFFNDPRTKFFHLQSCHFDPMVLCGHSNIMITMLFAHPTVLRVFHNWSCFSAIIKEGMLVPRTGKWPNCSFWKEFKPEEQYTEEYFFSLRERVRNEKGVINI